MSQLWSSTGGEVENKFTTEDGRLDIKLVYTTDLSKTSDVATYMKATIFAENVSDSKRDLNRLQFFLAVDDTMPNWEVSIIDPSGNYVSSLPISHFGSRTLKASEGMVEIGYFYWAAYSENDEPMSEQGTFQFTITPTYESDQSPMVYSGTAFCQ
ncbi:hypothetical protein [Thalassospira sp.]|uniref:hypothetical protein n=1 Tax=Thalassospira sp. TaxID=1912094 RepID=UPI00257C90CF|nr:hypothetical protein [Thalassospira sp.]